MSLSLPEDDKKYVYAVYILQALSFLTLFTAVIGLIVNLVKRDDVRGTVYESHFRWQIRTFWFALLWTVLGTLTTALMIGWLVLFVVMFWLIYRIAKGWIRLVDGKPMLDNK